MAEPMVQAFRAHRVGTKARLLLSNPGLSGRVLAALPFTVYLLTSSEEMFWLAGDGATAHRRSVMTSFHPGSCYKGQNFFGDGRRLVIGTSSIEWADSEEWTPQDGKTVRPGEVNHLFKGLLRGLSARRGEGLGRFIPFIAAAAQGGETRAPAGDVLTERALGPLRGVVKGCLMNDPTQISEAGKDLVGLGWGLTPSGDDFVGGVLFAAHVLKAAYPDLFCWDESPFSRLIAWAGPQTNLISHILLSDFALGYGPEPLHDLMTGMLAGRSCEHLLGYATRLAGIGHTSGWDLLAGVMCGMLLLNCGAVYPSTFQQ